MDCHPYALGHGLISSRLFGNTDLKLMKLSRLVSLILVRHNFCLELQRYVEPGVHM